MMLAILGCQKASDTPASDKKVAATNTYLESGAFDLLGSDVQIIRLAEPGMCPSSVDVRPSQVTELQHCWALLRFDFQKSLDAKVQRDTNTLQIIEISEDGGLCEPASYLSACRQLADSFVSFGWMERPAANARLDQIAERLKLKEAWAREEMERAKLSGRPVIASRHQKAFCEWLGLKVVAAFRSADTASIGEIEHAIDAGTFSSAKLVIANLPEGRRTADALAERLSGKVVVFENFPALQGNRVSFDQMFTSNVEALVKAAGS
jgi:ABC-type Zn uptake system ZnuABC Zn-binding protein ZnuA